MNPGSTASARLCEVCGKATVQDAYSSKCMGCKIQERARRKITPEEWRWIQDRRQKELLAFANAGHPDGKTRAWGYRRCSHPNSRDTRGGLDNQTAQVEAYFTFKQTTYPDMVWGGWFSDEAVSAWKYNLDARPGGMEMLRTARRGDHILILSTNRVFRNNRDAHNTAALIKARGITLHFVEMQVDMSTAIGYYIFSQMVAAAELEATMCSERTKAAFAAKKAQGYYIAPRPPFGMKLKGKKAFRRLVPMSDAELEPYRPIMQRVVQLRERGLAWDTIRSNIGNMTRANGKLCYPGERTVRAMYDIEKQLQAKEAQQALA